MNRSRGRHLSAPACQAKPKRPKDRNIPYSASHKTQEAELVVFGHLTVPAKAFLRPRKPNHNIRHRGIRK